MSTTRTCAHCGAEFSPGIGENRAITCSPGCSAERKRLKDIERSKARYRQAPPPAPRACCICGQMFTPTSHRRTVNVCGDACRGRRKRQTSGNTKYRARLAREAEQHGAMRRLLCSPWGRRA